MRCSPFATHSDVIAFINQPTPQDNLPQEEIAQHKAMNDSNGGSHNQVEAKIVVQGHIYLDCLFNVAQGGIHHYQQVNIAIGAGVAVGVAAEQDDEMGVELRGNLVHHLVNRLLRDALTLGGGGGR